MKVMKLAVLGAIIGFAAPAFAETLSFSPGEWTATVSGTVNGQAMSNEKIQDCMSPGENTITASDLEDIMGDTFECQYSNVQRTSSTITADVVCQLTGESMVYNGTSVINYTQTDFSLDITGALIGEGGMSIPAGLTASAERISPVCQ